MEAGDYGWSARVRLCAVAGLVLLVTLLGAVQASAQPAFSIGYNTLEENGPPYNFVVNTSTHNGGWMWQSAGSGCGPRDYVLQEGKHQATEWSANCEANLGKNAPNGNASLVIDGKPAYAPYSAKIVYEGQTTKRTAPGPGEPFIREERHTLNPATGALAEQSWIEELARCKPAAECEAFEGTGVQLVRTITLQESGLQATVEDRFESTDGHSHTITVSYGEEQINLTEHPPFKNEEPAYRFPEETKFGYTGAANFGHRAPATVYFETRAGHPEGLENPREALTLSSLPTAATFEKRGVFTAVYEGEIVHPGGPVTLTHVLSQALTQTEVERLAHVYEEGSREAPAVSITAPANHSSSSTASIAVSGTTQAGSAEYPNATLTVQGQAVKPAANGTWSTNVTLNAGENTITAVATSGVGRQATTSITVTYAPPKEEHKEGSSGGSTGGTTTTTTGTGGTAGFKAASPPPPPPPAVAALTATPSGRNGHIVIPVSCTGRSGQRCRITILATVRERLRGRTVIGLLARAPSSTSRSVTIATGQFTLAAGQSQVLVIALNRTGAALLAHHHALPAALHVRLVAEPGATTTIGRLVTITPAPRGHRHK